MPERRQWHRFGVSIVKIWTYLTLFSSISIVDFEQVNVNWEFIITEEKLQTFEYLGNKLI